MSSTRKERLRAEIDAMSDEEVMDRLEANSGVGGFCIGCLLTAGALAYVSWLQVLVCEYRPEWQVWLGILTFLLVAAAVVLLFFVLPATGIVAFIQWRTIRRINRYRKVGKKPQKPLQKDTNNPIITNNSKSNEE